MKKLLTLFILSIFIISCSAEDSCEPTPKLTTSEATEITDVSATVTGTITPPTCDETVTSQGFVYGESELPTVDDTKIIKSGNIISASLTNLEQNKVYFIRTFFENPTGVYYGNEISFTTIVGDALVQTISISNVSFNSAYVLGKVISNGGGSIISKGFCFTTKPNPTVDDQIVEGVDDNNQFNSTLNNLTPNTQYYLKAYAENESGVFYGEEMVFKTDCEFDTDRDGLCDSEDNDDDGDGENDVDDCSPLNPNINSSQIEICDGIDNNCDGQIDEGFGFSCQLQIRLNEGERAGELFMEFYNQMDSEVLSNHFYGLYYEGGVIFDISEGGATIFSECIESYTWQQYNGNSFLNTCGSQWRKIQNYEMIRVCERLGKTKKYIFPWYGAYWTYYNSNMGVNSVPMFADNDDIPCEAHYNPNTTQGQKYMGLVVKSVND